METFVLAICATANYTQPSSKFAGTDAEDRYYRLQGGNSRRNLFPMAWLVSIIGILAVGLELFPH